MVLPAKAGAVRDLRISGRMVAVATQGAGLVLMSTATDNVMASFDAGKPVWSCCWSQRNDQQVGNSNFLFFFRFITSAEEPHGLKGLEGCLP